MVTMNFLSILGIYVMFSIAGFAWFLLRMDDKHARNRRWWVKVLDAVLITPIIPYAMLLGYIFNRKR